jgi:hypothetical protein
MWSDRLLSAITLADLQLLITDKVRECWRSRKTAEK